MTQAEGISSVHETMFDNRLGYTVELAKMGAHIDVSGSGRTAMVHGPSALRGAQVQALDIRSGAAVVLAGLAAEGRLLLPVIPPGASNNAHMFYVVCRSLDERTALIAHLKRRDILSVFHYLPLHRSPFYAPLHDGRELPHADRFADCLLRLPMYYDLTTEQAAEVSAEVRRFFA